MLPTKMHNTVTLQHAKDKGYEVLIVRFSNCKSLNAKIRDWNQVMVKLNSQRVDADHVDNLIKKDDNGNFETYLMKKKKN